MSDVRVNPWTLPLFFTLLLSLAGCSYVLLTPPFQVPDAPWHFFRSFQLARGQVIGEKRGPVSGGEVSLAAEEDCVHFTDLPFHNERKLGLSDFEGRVRASRDLTEEELRRAHFTSFPSTVLNSPVPYLAQAIGIAIAARLHWRDISAFYLATLFALLGSMLCLLLSFRALSFSFRASCIVFVIAGLPMTLFLLASISADGPTISLSILSTALALRLRHRFDRRIFAAFLVSAALVGCCKGIYFMVPVCLLPLVLADAASRARAMSRAALVLLAALLPAMAWSALIRHLYTPLRAGVDASLQLQFMLHHPFTVLSTFAGGLHDHARDTLIMFVGDLGWLDVEVPPAARVICYALLIAVPLVGSSEDAEKSWKGWATTAWTTLTFLAFVLLLCISQYATWNTVGGEFTELQGRYFTPFAVAVLCLVPRAVRLGSRPRLVYAALMLAAWSTVWWRTAGALLHRYWLV